jgi:septal ring factor EnvC (AmiA/AmiB activator)
MAKALKTLIIIQLIISAGALALGILLFQQREILKGRTQVLEQATANFAESIHQDFSVPSIMDYQTMQGPLRNLSAAGAELWQELQDTKAELEQTKEELRATKLELVATKSELNDARDQVYNLTQELSQAKEELERANTQVADLETQVAGLRGELEALNERVLAVEEERDEWESRYEACDAELQICLGGKIPNVMGRVLVVNPEWNFVVIDIGKSQGLSPPAEMLVHREDDLIGRIRLSTVQEEMAVGQILGDWEQRSIQAGDFVISPES